MKDSLQFRQRQRGGVVVTIRMGAWVGILLASLLVVSCDRVSDLLGTGPRAALTAYLDATIHGDSEVAYGYLSSEDQAVRTLAAYKAKASNELIQALATKTTYVVISIEKHGDTASAQVDLTAPDLSGAFADILGSAFASAFAGAKQEEFKKKLAAKYSEGEFPTTTKREKFTLLRQSDGWRVFLDWETTERVSTLLSDAKQLKKEKKLHAALEKYDQALKLNSELVDAKAARAETKREIEEFAEKEEYIGKVVLYDLEAGYYETYLDKRVPGVKFKLKNTGDRALNEVEVTVYFKAADGSIISEANYYPVLVSKSSLRGNKPLKPNYIWQMERGKFYKADSVPSEWKEGFASAKITDIEFATR